MNPSAPTDDSESRRNDALVIRAVQQQESDAFTQLLRLIEKQMLGAAIRRLGKQRLTEAEEIVCDISSWAWERILSGDFTLSTNEAAYLKFCKWIFTRLGGEVIDRKRAEKRRLEKSTPDPDPGVTELSPLEEMAARETNKETQLILEQIRLVLAEREAERQRRSDVEQEKRRKLACQIPGKMGEAVRLVDIQGMTNDEAAKSVNANRNKFDARLSRGRKVMENLMREASL